MGCVECNGVGLQLVDGKDKPCWACGGTGLLWPDGEWVVTEGRLGVVDVIDEVQPTYIRESGLPVAMRCAARKGVPGE